MSILLGFLTVLLLPPFVVRVIIIFVNFRIRAKKKKQRETKKELRDVNAETVKDTVNITDKNRKKKLKRDEKRKVRLEKRKATIDAILTALRTLKAFLKTILHGIHILYWTLFIFLTTIIMPMYLFTLVMFAVVVILLINAYNKISGENQSSQVAEQQQQRGQNEVYLNTVLTADVEEIIHMTDSEVWYLISSGRFKTKAEVDEAYQADPVKEEEFWNNQVTDVEVPAWKWADSSHTSKVSGTVTIKVNKALVNYWTAFMKDLYACSDQYVVTQVGGFNVRTKNNGTGTKSLSAHSFGAVLDINWNTKGMGSNAAGIGDGTPFNSCQGLSEPYRSECCCFDGNWNALITKYDLDWGGNWSAKYLDPMHFSIVGDNKKGARQNAPKTAGQSPK